jgi:hypothetical protein
MAEGWLAFAVSALVVGVAGASRLIMNVHCALIAIPYEIGFCA